MLNFTETCCGYSFEVPCKDTSNKYLQHMFSVFCLTERKHYIHTCIPELLQAINQVLIKKYGKKRSLSPKTIGVLSTFWDKIYVFYNKKVFVTKHKRQMTYLLTGQIY